MAAIKDVERFLAMPSSTKSGLISGYRDRANTINQKYGFKGNERLTWKDIAILFQDSTWDQLTHKMTSGQVWKQIATQKKQEKTIMRQLKKAVEKNQLVSDDAAVMQKIKENLKNSNLTLKDLV